jgi:hypothetical protein
MSDIKNMNSWAAAPKATGREKSPSVVEMHEGFNKIFSRTAGPEEEDEASKLEREANTLEADFWSQWQVILHLSLMYMVQGLIFSLAKGLKSVVVYDQGNCPPENERDVMSWLNNTNWPWTFKILVAPIVDGLPLFGMRKYHRRGFIAGAGIVAAFLLFALAWDYKNLVNKESCANGFGLWVYIILAVFMASVQDVALDGLTIIALAGRNIGYGAALQGFGKKFGQDGGKAMILVLNKTFNLPVWICIATIGVMVLISAASALMIKERVPEQRLDSLWEAYLTVYRCLCNKYVLALALWAFMRGDWVRDMALDSDVDKKNRGLDKADMTAEAWVSAGFAMVVMALVARFVVSKRGPLMKHFANQWLVVVATVSIWLVFYLAPYVDGKLINDSIEHADNCFLSCSPVFWWWVSMGVVTMPIIYGQKMLYQAVLMRRTPEAYAGIFVTTIHVFGNAARQTARGVAEAARKYLNEPKIVRCNGMNDNFGKLVNTTSGARFCGTITCTAEEGLTGYCNPWGDGYNVFALVCTGVFVCFLVIYYLLLPMMRADKSKFDPDNEESRISWCPRCEKAQSPASALYVPLTSTGHEEYQLPKV